MIHVEVKETETKKELTFPKLMISQRGVIVLFTSKNTGVCLFDGNNTVGFVASGWDMSSFKDFDGEITLKNE